MTLKNFIFLTATGVATAIITSEAWAIHLRHVVEALTVISIRNEIESDLHFVKGLDIKKSSELTSNVEEDLASSTIQLLAVLNNANSGSKADCSNVIAELRHYKFQSTNELTLAAKNLLQIELSGRE